jgi:ribosome biogenesis GTPase A
MKKVIDISDIVLEILDARYIEETRNIDIEELILKSGSVAKKSEFSELGNSKEIPSSSAKKLIYVFNKCDLVDRKELEKQIPKWMRPYVFVSATQGIGLNDLVARVKMEAKRILTERKARAGGVKIEKKKFEKKKYGVGKTKLKGEQKMAKEMRDESWGRVHVGVIGVPNAGKSSVINFMTRRSAAPTAAKAGYTKGMQKIRMSEGILVLDTPGVIPESRYTSERKGFAEDVKIGARSYSDVRDPERAVLFLVRAAPAVDPENLTSKEEEAIVYAKKAAEAIDKFYSIESEGDVEILMDELGKRRGFLGKGGVIDEDRTARLILRDWQSGAIRVK